MCFEIIITKIDYIIFFGTLPSKLIATKNGMWLPPSVMLPSELLSHDEKNKEDKTKISIKKIFKTFLFIEKSPLFLYLINQSIALI